MKQSTRVDVDKVQAVVRSVWTSAGYKEPVSGIVPLDDLIRSYPIRIAEVEGLTHSTATNYLISEAGSSISVPMGDDQQLSGFLYADRSGNACILVEREEPIQRRRFSAAHEFGHYIQHFLPVLENTPIEPFADLVYSEGLVYPDQELEEVDSMDAMLLTQPILQAELVSGYIILDSEQAEKEANRFAVELLMPEKAVRASVNQMTRQFGGTRGIIAKRLATQFLVSPEAMTWRLVGLGL